MKTHHTPLAAWICCASCLFVIAPTAPAAEATADRGSGATIAYRPPLRGAPLSRVGGGTRSIQAADLQVEVLAPEHTGLTLRDQPVVYWYASQPVTAPVEFALVRPGVPEPLLEVRLAGPFAAGIHAIDLADHGVSLLPETDYEWFVSVVFDPSQRSNDVTAGAGIRLVGGQDPVRMAVGNIPANGAAYAAAGLWYDAVASLSVAAPVDALAHAQRASLLEQVGLSQAAAAP